MTGDPTVEVVLREVVPDDLPILFEQHRDPEANRMAAFTVEDPSDEREFMARWHRILNDDSVKIRAIVIDGAVAGSVLRYHEKDRPEVSYWLGREFWGRGIATAALARFVAALPERPLFARAAADNGPSLRVLEKCGFSITGKDRGYAHARGEETDELVLRRDAP